MPAQLWVVEAEIDSKNWDAAEAAADRALLLDPDSAPAHLLKANVFMGRGETDRGAYAKARPHFVRARNLDPLDPRPAIGYYLSFRSEEHTSELQSLIRIPYAVFCLKKKNKSHVTYK